ncbi:MAG TPA: PBP1A family penicillin-binding protein [Virgibacillus sp.]|nr:PBP1A family penicillin-binding protein [Virgibacillus sp.]
MGQYLKTFKKLHMSIKIVITMIVAFLMVTATIYFISFLLGPPPLTNEQNTLYYSADDDVIGHERGSENRYWVTLDEISEELINATLIVEDKQFYKHKGFDLKRMLGAIISDIRSLSLKEGASTLTQQYARNLYLSHEKTWTRKIKEAFYTVRLEMFYTKDEILEGYLNTIYFGHGAYGIETASKHFFNKNARDLTLAEAAMLAGVPKGPTYYSPLNDEQRAKRRQSHILNLLVNHGHITDEDNYLASREQLTYATETMEDNNQQIGPYFQDTVLKEASRILKIDQELVRSGGYSIYTTMELDEQRQLEDTINNVIHDISDIQVGAIAMDPHTGAIQALVGGRDYQSSSFNRAMSAKRMPGSTFKPFLYYTALNYNYTSSTRLLSKPTNFILENEEVYAPSNYNGYYANEPITLGQALAVSDNIYAVKTNLFIGTEKLPEVAKDFGIQSELPAVPSLALGTATVTVNEMVTGFGKLANGGQDISSFTIRKIVDRHGKTIYKRSELGGTPLLDPKKTFIITHLLTGMFDTNFNGYMNVTGSSIADQLSRTYAGKSGTTTSDSWMIGYSPTRVTGIWTGYDDNRSIEVVAETNYAKEIWAQFMEAAHADEEKQEFTVPRGVVGVNVDPLTGDLATSYCPSSRMMYYESGTEPQHHCSTHFPNHDHQHDQENDDDQGLFERLFDLFIFKNKEADS